MKFRGGAPLKEKKKFFRKRKDDQEKIRKQASQKGTSKTFQFIRNIPIGGKYMLVFFITVILFIAATLLVYSQLSIAKNDVEHIIEVSDLTKSITELALLIEQQDTAINSYIIVDDERYVSEYDNLQAKVDEILNRLDGRFTKDHQSYLEIIKKNNSEISELFLNKIINSQDETEIAVTQIELNNKKNRIIVLVNTISEDLVKMQSEAIVNVNKSMNNSIQSLIWINALSIVTGLIILLFIGLYISRNLKRVVHTTDLIASGDLTVEPLTYKGKDEIGMLAASVNLLQHNIKNIVTKVSEATKAISESSGLLMQSSQEVKEGSAQMVTTMDQLASGAENQASSASDLAGKMNQFVESVQSSEQTGRQVAERSKQVLDLTDEGVHMMNESVQQMDKIDKIVSESVEKVRGLDEKSNEIFHLVEVVKDIADQTNLLALNAAIEAARAGEHGRGFAVVAEEVRKLAEEVANSVTEITNIVHSIRKETDEVVQTLNSGYAEVKTGAEQIVKTGNSFKEIESYINSTVTSISKVADNLGEIAENSKQMNDLISDIAAVSEEAAAGVEQSSAATQETSSAMDEISDKATELARLAEQLTHEVSAFKI